MSDVDERAERLREIVTRHQGDFLPMTVEEIYADNATPLLAAIVEELGITSEDVGAVRAAAAWYDGDFRVETEGPNAIGIRDATNRKRDVLLAIADALDTLLGSPEGRDAP
jgi:hypothetical protein